MKTAISLPDELFARGERCAKRMRLSRSELYYRALSEYLEAHEREGSLTDRINAALAASGEDDSLPFLREAARRSLRRSDR